jgi:hypothetical protein
MPAAGGTMVCCLLQKIKNSRPMARKNTPRSIADTEYWALSTKGLDL